MLFKYINWRYFLRFYWWVFFAAISCSVTILWVLFTHNKEVKELLTQAMPLDRQHMVEMAVLYIDDTFRWVLALLTLMSLSLIVGSMIIARHNYTMMKQVASCLTQLSCGNAPDVSLIAKNTLSQDLITAIQQLATKNHNSTT